MAKVTKENFVNYLNNLGVRYDDESVDGHECVRVYGAPTNYINPHGYTVKYTPYLRVSKFGERDDELYVRDNGWCDWYTLIHIHEICVELKRGEI